MKIAFLGLNMFTYGGIQRVVCTLCNELIKEHNVTVIMPYKGNEDNIFNLSDAVTIKNLYEMIEERRTITTIPRKMVLKIKQKTGVGIECALDHCLITNAERKRLANYINDNEFDVVVGLEERYTYYLAAIASQVKAHTIGWMHDTFESYFCIQGKYSYRLEHLFSSQFKKLDTLIALTNVDREKFASQFMVDTFTLYNPVSYVGSSKIINAAPRKNLLFVGRLVNTHKGLDHLLKIAQRVIESDDNVILRVVGDGPDKEKMQLEAAALGIEKNVSFEGKNANVADYYENADIVLHTSNYEAFGVVIIEAMIFGTPVVAFENVGPNEIINNTVNGFLIKKYDYDAFAKTVVRLLNDDQEYKDVSQRARERAEAFSVETFAAGAVKIFEKAVEV